MSAEFIRREFSTPSKDGAQRIRQRLWSKAHSMVVKKCSPTTEVKSVKNIAPRTLHRFLILLRYRFADHKPVITDVHITPLSSAKISSGMFASLGGIWQWRWRFLSSGIWWQKVKVR
ncbi:MAG: hypothetical protein N3B10_05240 [Armatimonadetes bacterium]|nr:hypothetical protein [Armatimonadota bacterium]MCX7967879.1 hypothetical protein [Armatimonadota bacterium]MDW8142307.1 hypothetical protein [Armatimonadota bacterium]